MKTLFCLGELLIDWISTDINKNLVEATHFIKKAGGAPANVAISCARLGGKAAFAGKVGKDAFGDFLIQTLEKNSVSVENLVQSEQFSTTFAFVSLKENGDRDFIFSRGADEHLKIEELKLPKENAIFHFGSATGFLGGELSKTYFETLKYAKDNLFFISFDPNFRDALWENSQAFISSSLEFISQSDLIKLSHEEALLISGKENIQNAIDFFETKKDAIICITLGEKGTLVKHQKNIEIIPSIKVKTIDTTGAGDAFVGAMLKQICENIPNDWESVKNMVKFSNKVAAISTTKLGAIEALPSKNEIPN